MTKIHTHLEKRYGLKIGRNDNFVTNIGLLHYFYYILVSRPLQLSTDLLNKSKEVGNGVPSTERLKGSRHTKRAKLRFDTLYYILKSFTVFECIRFDVGP